MGLLKSWIKKRANRADALCVGRGVEIGALSKPFRFSSATMVYADVATDALNGVEDRGVYDRSAIVTPTILLKPPRFEFADVSADAFDFVYSSHVLEHTPNPLFALKEQLRVARTVYAVIPDKRFCYDRERRVTPLDTLIHKFDGDTFDYTFGEAMDVVMNTVDHPGYTRRTEEHAREILADGSGAHHFHVFDARSARAMARYAADLFGARLVHFMGAALNIHFCLQR